MIFSFEVKGRYSKAEGPRWGGGGLVLGFVFFSFKICIGLQLFEIGYTFPAN